MARTNRKHTFTVVKDLYRETSSRDGTRIERKVIKRDATWEVDFYLDDIIGVQHVINLRGNVKKDVCEIMHKDRGDWVVLGSKKEISKIVFGDENDESSIGFKLRKKL